MKKKIMSLLLLLVIGYAFLYIGLFFFSSSPNIEIAAHRGDASHFPENTLPAFESAYEKGVDYIELDLHQTKDNVIVVLHDNTLDRTTDGSGQVKDYTYDQIRKLNAGNGAWVPTLTEVLDLAKKNNGKLIAEIKSPEIYPGIEGNVISLLEKHSYEEKVIIASFDKNYIEGFKSRYPQIKTCVVYDWKMVLPTKSGSSEYVCMPAENTLLFPWSLWYAKYQEKKTFIWFQIIESSFVKWLLGNMGVNGLVLSKLN